MVVFSGMSAPAASLRQLTPGLSQTSTVPLTGATTTSFLNSGAGGGAGFGDGVGTGVGATVATGVGVAPPATVKLRVDGERSGLPAASSARTWKVCGPG